MTDFIDFNENHPDYELLKADLMTHGFYYIIDGRRVDPMKAFE